jgi:hypothetical protein
MFYSGQAPWFRFFPPADGITQEDLQKSEKMRMSILEYAMENYKVVIFKDDFIFNDPDNPEEVNERAKPIRRLLSAVHNEFDPGNIMNPAIKKYTLL